MDDVRSVIKLLEQAQSSVDAMDTGADADADGGSSAAVDDADRENLRAGLIQRVRVAMICHEFFNSVVCVYGLARVGKKKNTTRNAVQSKASQSFPALTQRASEPMPAVARRRWTMPIERICARDSFSGYVSAMICYEFFNSVVYVYGRAHEG